MIHPDKLTFQSDCYEVMLQFFLDGRRRLLLLLQGHGHHHYHRSNIHYCQENIFSLNPNDHLNRIMLGKN
ncbi:hypothetical protein BLA29_010232 [Euroglyphus maynei]|uniref:Uncharacterized protein n=1 Tax=Euroglyphus maynei TaxID=6958 RepID=A0A1Y3BW96_EURMA|nr:hypothetical protein BLA29_010232 [Euroglyphus maynei]